LRVIFTQAKKHKNIIATGMAVIMHYYHQGSDNVFMEFLYEENEKADRPFLNLKAEARKKNLPKNSKHVIALS